MSLEGLRSAITCITTDLTGVGDVQTMQLVQPVRDGLQETERYLKRMINKLRDTFQCANQLPQVGLEPTTLDRVLYQLSY